MSRRPWTCKICGRPYLGRAETPPRRNCRVDASRGLGDTIAKITGALGIKPCAKCKEKRQPRLNELFPYR